MRVVSKVVGGQWPVAGGRFHLSRFTFQGESSPGDVSRITHYASRLPGPLLYFIVALLLILLLWLFLAPQDDGTLAEIQRRGTLRVGLDASFPPFETVDEQGQIVGLDVDLAREIAADLGVEVELVNIGFDGLYDALLARRVDIIISGLPYDPRWTGDVGYSHNYFNAGQVLMARRDDPTIETVADLAGRAVAVEWGSQADMEGRRLAEELADVTLLRQPTAAGALAALTAGQADAAIVDGVSAHSPAAGDLRLVAYLTDEWYAAAVHLESRELLAAVNDTLARLEESGEMAELQARWLGGR
jgi:polar amino acid transport system substrate-binding protein